MVDDAIRSLHALFFTSLLVLLLWLLTWPAATEKIRLYHGTAEVTAWAAMRETLAYQKIAALPGVEGIWQGHLSLAAPDANTARDQIANLEDSADCKGNWIKASVAPDGKFTITNGRNGFSKTYVARGSGS
jgi:hypothetical protein